MPSRLLQVDRDMRGQRVEGTRVGVEGHPRGVPHKSGPAKPFVPSPVRANPVLQSQNRLPDRGDPRRVREVEPPAPRPAQRGKAMPPLFGGLPTAESKDVGDLHPGSARVPGPVDQLEFLLVQPFAGESDIEEPSGKGHFPTLRESAADGHHVDARDRRASLPIALATRRGITPSGSPDAAVQCQQHGIRICRCAGTETPQQSLSVILGGIRRNPATGQPGDRTLAKRSASLTGTWCAWARSRVLAWSHSPVRRHQSL
jgi:hypothetical protein